MDLAKLINNNINVALVCDERRFNGIKIDFLGHKAYCNTVPSIASAPNWSENLHNKGE